MSSFSIQRMYSYGSFSKLDLYIVFIFQTVLQYVELQHADHADDDLLHTGVELLEDLDRTFLGDLADPLDELLALHRVHLTHPREMLRREGRNPLKCRTFCPAVQSVSPIEKMPGSNTPMISPA